MRIGRSGCDAIIESPVDGRFHVIRSWYCLKPIWNLAAMISSALERVLKFEK